MALHLNKPESSSPRDAMCHVWLKLAHWFWRRKFLNLSMYFRYFVIISPSKRSGSIIWTILNPSHSRMLCAKFGWNLLTGSGEDLWNLSMYFHYFLLIINYLPLEKGGDLHLNKLEWPSPKILCAKFCQCYFGWNAQRFWRRRRECEKFTRTTMTMDTNKLWSEKLTRNAHMKRQCFSTHCVKVISKVKVFKSRLNTKVKVLYVGTHRKVLSLRILSKL